VSSSPVPRIFVVDDEPVVASTLAAILQMNGFSAKFFTCPLEALTAARSKAPDLLILPGRLDQRQQNQAWGVGGVNFFGACHLDRRRGDR
jgi:CheY-like chemotaxis protein